MKLWLIFGLLSYLSYAISTSIDKYMMNKKFDILRTNTFKMFFDGLILLIIGFIFFNLSFTSKLIFWALILGTLYALSGILYFNIIKLRDVSEIMPYLKSGQILFVFIVSIIVFSESTSSYNYLGIILILIGVYTVLLQKGFKLPKLDKAIFLVIIAVILGTIYFVLAKKILYNVEPINLGITMYFSSALIMVLYQLIFKKRKISSVVKIKSDVPKIILAAFFGAMGTFLIYSGLAIGDASKVYSVSGIQVVFIFIIATLFLKEKFRWHRLIGTLLVFAGIFLISI